MPSPFNGPIPPANAAVSIVPLSIDAGPNNMRLVVADESRSLTSARSPTYAEWRSGTKVSAGGGYFRQLRGDPHTLLFYWDGGACDDRARLVISADTTTLHFFQGPPVGCDAIGVSWFVALTFDHAVPVDALSLTWSPWFDGEEPMTAERSPVLVQGISRSIAPTVVLSTATAPWEPDQQAITVTLGGRYRFCGATGSCHKVIGHEIFGVTVPNGDLVSYRLLEGLP